MDNEAFGIPDIREMRKQLYSLSEFLGRFQPAFDTETDQTAVLSLQIFFGKFMIGIIFQTGIIDPGDGRMFGQEMGDLQRIGGMLLLS